MKTDISKIDLERLILVPIFSFLMFMSVMGTYSFITQHTVSGYIFIISVAHKLTLICFYLLIVIMFFKRSTAITTTKSIRARVIAYTGTFLPFGLILLGHKLTAQNMRTLISTGVMLLSMFFAVYSLAALGKSFGIVPQVRSLSRRGPYRYIRHPLYSAEIMAFGGAIIPVLSVVSLAILMALVLVQVYRAGEEERILERNFPDYAEYRRSTKRFIPGLV